MLSVVTVLYYSDEAVCIPDIYQTLISLLSMLLILLMIITFFPLVRSGKDEIETGEYKTLKEASKDPINARNANASSFGMIIILVLMALSYACLI